LHSTIRIPEYIGFGPVLLFSAQKDAVANGIFEQSFEDLGGGQWLIRTFLKEGRVLVGLATASSDPNLDPDFLRHPVGDFTTQWHIPIRYIE
jgi:hypothetical protein